MKKVVFFILVVLSSILSSCVKDSDWGKVIVPANQALVFSTFDNPFDNYERNIFIKTSDGGMFLTNRNLIYRICYLKAAFPEKDIVVEYVKIKEGDKTTPDPRFVMIQE